MEFARLEIRGLFHFEVLLAANRLDPDPVEDLRQACDAGPHVGDETALLEVGRGQRFDERLEAASTAALALAIVYKQAAQQLSIGLRLLRGRLVLRERLRVLLDLRFLILSRHDLADELVSQAQLLSHGHLRGLLALALLRQLYLVQLFAVRELAAQKIDKRLGGLGADGLGRQNPLAACRVQFVQIAYPRQCGPELVDALSFKIVSGRGRFGELHSDAKLGLIPPAFEEGGRDHDDLLELLQGKSSRRAASQRVGHVGEGGDRLFRTE